MRGKDAKTIYTPPIQRFETPETEQSKAEGYNTSFPTPENQLRFGNSRAENKPIGVKYRLSVATGPTVRGI